MKQLILIPILASCLLSVFFAITPEFKCEDVPYDAGQALALTWKVPSDSSFVVIQKADSLGVFNEIHAAIGSSGSYTDTELSPQQEYRYRLIATTGSDSLSLDSSGKPVEQWFYLGKLSFLILLVIICAAILLYINMARRGKELFIRRISGLDSMEEAVGRATEKGKPILFVPGISDLDDIQTIAALTILSHLAAKSAEYNTDLIVPCRYSMVLSAAREVVKAAYLTAGKPDAYKEKNIFYLTDDQFGYVAGIDGIMVREQPAANFFLGSFYAESLILAETGFSTGAIQTSGTAQAHQLPFFVVSCDYTLIGEELFAASAYLSKDPQQLGSLKGHDFGKLLIILLILIGIVMEIAGQHWFKGWFSGEVF
ncbi:MAG TPA: fibronectin type III domain-containing protein [Candidatus Cloacimonadota bacterium]|nr:fibronectin type III domain-containing protein [Candidatus Cloacimonadota bacterium]